MLAFDIGANCGKVTDLLWDRGYNVISIDADTRSYDKLIEKYNNNPDVTVLNYAVANKDDELIDFYQCNWSVASSASEQWVFNGRFTRKKKWTKTQVKTITLDTLIKQYGKPDLVKVDVEGYEWEVLRGLNQKVGRIMFEWSEEIFVNTVMISAHLQSLGYSKWYYSDRDTLIFDNINYVSWDNLNWKDILPERKKRWGMVYCD